jgi:2-amino-4-hydroxy-6-hydroxymethyldihydropteridine diphosphokinase
LARVFVGLGSNLGDRAARILGGVRGCVEHGFRLTHLSPVYETTPVGGPAGQSNYLNAAAIFEIGLDAMVVLRILQQVEAREGRVRRAPNEPRTLDLDLLLFGEETRSHPDLVIPHPRLHERLFVLRPLADIAPDAVVPNFRATVRELLARRLTDRGAPAEEVRPYAPADFAAEANKTP